MNATIPVLMASIEINYNIMGPPGSTDPDKTLSPDKSLDREIDFQPERPVQNRMDPFIRSEGSPPNNPSFLDLLGGSDPPMSYGSTTATVKGHAAFGVGGKRQRTAGADERIRFDPSIDLMGTGNNFENRGFSATDPARSSLSSALMNDDSFEMDENLVGFIDINDPMGSLPLTDTFEDNNDSYAYPHHLNHCEDKIDEGSMSATTPNKYEKEYIYSLYAHSSYAPQRQEKNMDTKPAAIDSNIFKRQHHQHYFPHQQSTYPTQASKDALYFGGPLDRFSQNQDLTGVKMNNRKAPPTASSATEIRMKSLKTPPSASTQRSEQSHHGQSVRKSNPKAPPVRSLSGRTSLRSYRATSLATKMDDNTKNRPSEVIKLTRSKTCVGSNAKTINKEMNLSLSMQPTQTQMTEARGPRKVEALRTWYKRLGELICFKDSHGHGKIFSTFSLSGIHDIS